MVTEMAAGCVLKVEIDRVFNGGLVVHCPVTGLRGALLEACCLPVVKSPESDLANPLAMLHDHPYSNLQHYEKLVAKKIPDNMLLHWNSAPERNNSASNRKDWCSQNLKLQPSQEWKHKGHSVASSPYKKWNAGEMQRAKVYIEPKNFYSKSTLDRPRKEKQPTTKVQKHLTKKRGSGTTMKMRSCRPEMTRNKSCKMTNTKLTRLAANSCALSLTLTPCSPHITSQHQQLLQLHKKASHPNTHTSTQLPLSFLSEVPGTGGKNKDAAPALSSSAMHKICPSNSSNTISDVAYISPKKSHAPNTVSSNRIKSFSICLKPVKL